MGITFTEGSPIWNTILTTEFLSDIANEGPKRIQYKCLVPIYVCIPRNDTVIPSSSTLIYLWEIYIFPGSVCLFCCRDRSLEYINQSKTHECGNWHWGHAIPRKGIHEWDFPCSVHYQRRHLFKSLTWKDYYYYQKKALACFGLSS